MSETAEKTLFEFLSESKKLVNAMPKLYSRRCVDCNGEWRGRSYQDGVLTITCMCGKQETWTDLELAREWRLEQEEKEVVNDSVQDE